jgi:hypothetical protein
MDRRCSKIRTNRDFADPAAIVTVITPAVTATATTVTAATTTNRTDGASTIGTDDTGKPLHEASAAFLQTIDGQAGVDCRDNDRHEGRTVPGGGSKDRAVSGTNPVFFGHPKGGRHPPD